MGTEENGGVCGRKNRFCPYHAACRPLLVPFSLSRQRKRNDRGARRRADGLDRRLLDHSAPGKIARQIRGRVVAGAVLTVRILRMRTHLRNETQKGQRPTSPACSRRGPSRSNTHIIMRRAKMEESHSILSKHAAVPHSPIVQKCMTENARQPGRAAYNTMHSVSNKLSSTEQPLCRSALGTRQDAKVLPLDQVNIAPSASGNYAGVARLFGPLSVFPLRIVYTTRGCLQLSIPTSNCSSISSGICCNFSSGDCGDEGSALNYQCSGIFRVLSSSNFPVRGYLQLVIPFSNYSGISSGDCVGKGRTFGSQCAGIFQVFSISNNLSYCIDSALRWQSGSSLVNCPGSFHNSAARMSDIHEVMKKLQIQIREEKKLQTREANIKAGEAAGTDDDRKRVQKIRDSVAKKERQTAAAANDMEKKTRQDASTASKAWSSLQALQTEFDLAPTGSLGYVLTDGTLSLASMSKVPLLQICLTSAGKNPGAREVLSASQFILC